MLEENKNLEATEKKKPGKSWLFWVGLFLIVLAIGLTIWLASLCKQECVLMGISLMLYIFPLGILGMALILIHYFLKFKRKRGARVIFIFLFLLLFWIALKITPLGEIWESSARKLAVTTKNEFICKVIPTNPLHGGRYPCYLAVAKEKGDAAVCGRVEPEYNKSYCYRALAEEKGDVALCDRVEHPYVRKECYEKLVETTNDESICEKFLDLGYPDDERYRNNCYDDIARSKKDPSLCRKVTDLNRSYLCTAVVTKNETVCEGFGNVRYQDECYHDVAREKKDPSLCGKITDLKWRSWCEENAK